MIEVTGPEILPQFSKIAAPIFRNTVMSLSKSILDRNQTFGKDRNHATVDFGGVVVTQTVYMKWYTKGTSFSGIHMKTDTWQVIWDHTGFYFDGDKEAVERDLIFLSMALAA